MDWARSGFFIDILEYDWQRIYIYIMIVICLPHLHNKGSPIPRPLFDNGNDPYRTSVSTTLSTLTNNGIPHISIVLFRVHLKQFLLLLLSMKFSIFFRSNNVKITFWKVYNSGSPLTIHCRWEVMLWSCISHNLVYCWRSFARFPL